MRIERYAPDWGRINWDISAPGIRCKLDSLGAHVYKIESTGLSIRILAHSQTEAKDTLEIFLKEGEDSEQDEAE